MHRDISMNNLMFKAAGENVPVREGMIIDFDCSLEVDSEDEGRKTGGYVSR